MDAFGFDWNLEEADDVEHDNAALELVDIANERSDFNISDMSSFKRLGCGKKIKGSEFKKTTYNNPIMWKTLGKPYPNKAKYVNWVQFFYSFIGVSL